MNLLQQLREVSAADRADAARRYATILARAATPAKGDLDAVRELAAMLGRGVDDIAGDAELSGLVLAADNVDAEVEAAGERASAARATANAARASAQQRRDEMTQRHAAELAELEAEVSPLVQTAESEESTARDALSSLRDYRQRVRESCERWRARLGLPDPARPAPPRPAPTISREFDPAREMIIRALIAGQERGGTFGAALERVNGELLDAGMPELDGDEQALLRRKVGA